METILKIDNIEKYYGNKSSLTKAIDNISFEVGKGEFVSIMGASGSGKSGKMSLEQEVELICANMKIACKENQKVYLTGSDLSGTSTEILEKIKAECEKRGLTVVSGREICYYAEALEELAKIGQVVFIEEMRKSRYNNMYQEVIRCREHQIPILGMIVIGA